MKRWWSKSASAALLLAAVPALAHANSSWHWLAGSPLTILPWTALGTLLVETLVIWRVGRVQGLLRVVAVTAAANLLSFCLPYLFAGLFPEIYMEQVPFLERIRYTAEKLPFYIVGVAFLLLTLLAEIPTVYYTLRNHTPNPKRLLHAVLAVNMLTTAAVAAIERILYQGRW